MKSSVIVFPGSNCDRDIDVALKKFKIKNEMVWHDDAVLPKSDLVVLPGGFSYGDYLRSGCIASKSKIIREVIKHAEKAGLLLGICNVFQILIETGLLPGALLRNNGYGAAYSDFDQDGDIDIILTGRSSTVGSVNLLKNDSDTGNYITLKLSQSDSNVFQIQILLYVSPFFQPQSLINPICHLSKLIDVHLMN